MYLPARAFVRLLRFGVTSKRLPPNRCWKPSMKKKITTIIGIVLLSHFASAQEKTMIRFGHFPNITHAQGVIAHALSRQGKGWFEQRLGSNVESQWFTYNAGPSAMEAIFAGSLDVTYVG